MTLFGRIDQLLRERVAVAQVTVVSTGGSTPRKPGARMLVFGDGRTEGSIGGGVVEHRVTQRALQCLRENRCEVVQFELTQELAMCCGGRMSFFVEPIVSEPALIVFGCGHVGSALVEAASPLGFDITAVDDLEGNANAERLPQVHRFVNSYEPGDLEGLPFGDNAYVIIATREHALDQRLLEICLRQQTRYIGVIGSPRKARQQLERLRAKDFDEAALQRVHCPVGLDIGAISPHEIAVSICAELVRIRRGGERFGDRK